MPDQSNSNRTSNDSVDNPLPALIKAYIDEQLKESKKSDDHSTNKSWKRSWRSTSPITKATLCLTAAVAFATVAYAFIAASQLSEMRRTNGLTQAALDRASQNSLESSKQFQVQLQHFDAGLGVNGLQIGKLDASITQATRLATATETANKNVLTADRPWMGAGVVVNKFAVNEKISFTFVFTNSGHRPARIEMSRVRFNAYNHFPDDPEKEYIVDKVNSTNFLVPGQAMYAANVSEEPLNPQVMPFLESLQLTYYAFGEVIYKDIRTNQRHWTHVCVFYIPKAKTDTDPGFRSCPEYNDADSD